MSSKSEIAQISKLILKKHREAEQKFIAEGKRLVLEGLKSKFICTQILVSNDFNEKETKLIHSFGQYSKIIKIVSNKDFDKISSTKNPQGIAAVFEIPKRDFDTKNQNIVICLENISDPGNVGTILRSCDWFGINSVLLSKDCADIYNPKVLRASMGAVFNLSIAENVNLITRIDELKSRNYEAYFADMDGMNYKNLNSKSKFTITFCNEAFGPSDELRDVCDDSVTIPKKGNIDSLNVAAAAAVILSQLT